MFPYVVQPGDTLYSIAQRFGVSPQSIMQANGITNPNAIFAGRTIMIPRPTPPGPFPPFPFPPGPGPDRTLEQRVARLEAETDRLGQRINRVDTEVDRLRQRVNRLEERVRRLEER